LQSVRVTASRSWGVISPTRRTHAGRSCAEHKSRPLLAGGVESLTPGERRIADLAAQGHSNREIAPSLFLTVTTLENHLTNADRKLDIHTRTVHRAEPSVDKRSHAAEIAGDGSATTSRSSLPPWPGRLG
jgi:DNA-binding CsgD family transcriptional regulator